MKNNDHLLQSAIAQYEARDFKSALKTASTLAGDKKHEAAYYELTGYCYYELEKYENAVFFLEKAVVLNPGYNLLQDKLALAYTFAGLIDKAREKFTYLYNTYPNSDLFSYRLGYFELTQQQYPEALPYLLEAVSINPDVHEEILYYLGTCYYNLDRWTESLPVLKKHTEKMPAFADSYYLIGSCYRHLGNNEAAICAYSQALWYDDNHEDALWQRFLAKKNEGDYEGAEKDIRRSLALNPNRIELTDKDGNPLPIIEVNIDRSNGSLTFVLNK